MTNNDELALKARDQHLPARYYLAECQECGEIMPSNKLRESRNELDGDSDCYCPHCNTSDCDIDDLGTGDEPAARAWNFQQKRIESLLAERDADKKLISEQQEIIAKQEKWIKDVEITMIAANDRAEAAEKRIAELEARTVSVKLSETSVGEACDFLSYVEVVSLNDLRNLCDRAGIKLEVGE